MIELTNEQYLALVEMARRGAKDPVALERYVAEIDKVNGVRRYALVLRWEEMNSPLPPTTRFPERWPPLQQVVIERTDRPISYEDVREALAQSARRPLNPMVTRDLAARVGWTELDVHFKRA